MFTQAKALITVAATILVITSMALGLTSAVWNLVALPATLCVMLLALAIYEYFEAMAEEHQSKVHCILKYLNEKEQKSNKALHQDAA